MQRQHRLLSIFRKSRNRSNNFSLLCEKYHLQPFHKLFREVFIIIILAIMVESMVITMPVEAADLITDFSPKSVVNNVDTAVTIEGGIFADGVQVKLGDTSVSVTFFSTTQLIVRIPSGFPSGEYSVSVKNPLDSSAFSSPVPLMVTAPTPTPSPLPTARPQIVIDTYSLSVDYVRYGQDFSLDMSLDNSGG